MIVCTVPSSYTNVNGGKYGCPNQLFRFFSGIAYHVRVLNSLEQGQQTDSKPLLRL